jgi:acyl-CoA reductase-like NAD-dependent aldehyde dehydrogenase
VARERKSLAEIRRRKGDRYPSVHVAPGLLHINDQTVADEPHVPFGAVARLGNGTRIGGAAN